MREAYRPGRDRMLDQIAHRPAGAVLEMGCGTARNLRVLGETASRHTLYGLEPSLSKLATARDKLDRAGCTERVTLVQGELAQKLRPKDQFGADGPFDVIFFSYVLSMIPAWDEALAAALSHLAPNGRLYIVDLWDPADLPSVVGATLRGWLGLLDVEPRPALLRTLEAEDRLSCSIVPVARRYAYLATIAHRDTSPRPTAPSPSTPRDEPPSESKRLDSGEIIPA